MARYKPVDTQPKFVAIDLAAQLLPGTFEHALHHLLEQAIDLTPFDTRYRNDTDGGAGLRALDAAAGRAVRLLPRHHQQSSRRAGRFLPPR